MIDSIKGCGKISIFCIRSVLDIFDGIDKMIT